MIRTGKDFILVMLTIIAAICIFAGACLTESPLAADLERGVKMMIGGGAWMLLFIAANYDRFRDNVLNL